MSRGNEKKEIFQQAADNELFLILLKDCSERFDFLVHAYCLMPNHFHLLIETRDANLSDAMKRLLGVYTMRYNRKHKRSGHLFQGRYKALLVDKDNYFLQLSRYIHLNPLKAGLVKDPQDYPYSSFRHFLNEKSPSFLHREFTLKNFDTPKNYFSFVMEGVNLDKDLLKRPLGGLFLGGEDFVEKFRGQVQKKKDQDFAGKRDLLKISPGRLQNYLSGQDQSFQIYCLWKFARLRQKEIGARFSITDSAISHSIQKFEAKIVKDKQLCARVLELQNSIFRD